MDANLTACTGLDALCHAMEAYVSVATSPITDLFAREAVRLVFAHLEAAISRPHYLEPRTQMMLASLRAGLAFSNAGLGAVHALAHSLGGMLDLPHGECNPLLLEHILAFNFDAAPERYRQLGTAMGLDLEGKPASTVQKALLDVVVSLRQAVGRNQTLGQLGLKPEHIPSLVNHALHDPSLVTNPRLPSRRDLEAIYEKSR